MIRFHVENGIVLMDKESMDEYNKFIGSLSNTGKISVMTISPYSPIITEKQHSLFKALLIEGSNISGYSYNEFEKELIDQFAPYKYQESIIGDKLKIRKKVSEMTNTEFNVFLEQSVLFSNEFYGLNFKL